MKKQILYFIPTSILVLYINIYSSLFYYITDIYLSKEIFLQEVNETMHKINIVIFIILCLIILLLCPIFYLA